MGSAVNLREDFSAAEPPELARKRLCRHRRHVQMPGTSTAPPTEAGGWKCRATIRMGYLAYMGTGFIATRESIGDPRYKDMLVASTADDIVLTHAFTGLQTNMLRPSIVAAGLDPNSLPKRGTIEISKDIDVRAHESRPARWHLERRPFDVRRPQSVLGGRSDQPNCA